MQSKTESTLKSFTPAERFSAPFLHWLAALTASTIMLNIIFRPLGEMIRFHPGLFWGHRPIEGLYPWLFAARVTDSDAIREFMGASAIPVSNEFLLGALISSLTFLVFIPALFLLSWRGIALHQHGERSDGPSGNRRPIGSAYHLIFGIAVSLAVLGIVPSVIDDFNSLHAFERQVRVQSIAMARDQIISKLSILTLDAYQYRILPKNRAGGGSSFVGYRIPDAQAVSDDQTFTIVEQRPSSIAMVGKTTWPVLGIVRASVDSSGEVSIHETDGF